MYYFIQEGGKTGSTNLPVFRWSFALNRIKARNDPVKVI